MKYRRSFFFELDAGATVFRLGFEFGESYRRYSERDKSRSQQIKNDAALLGKVFWMAESFLQKTEWPSLAFRTGRAVCL
jgi:hypothetical protein